MQAFPALVLLGLILLAAVEGNEDTDFDCFTQHALKLFVGSMRSRAMKMHKYQGALKCFDSRIANIQPYRTYPSNKTVCYLKNDFINLLFKCCELSGDMNGLSHGGQQEQTQQEIRTKKGTTDTATTTPGVANIGTTSPTIADTTTEAPATSTTNTNTPAVPADSSSGVVENNPTPPEKSFTRSNDYDDDEYDDDDEDEDGDGDYSNGGFNYSFRFFHRLFRTKFKTSNSS